MRIEGSHLNIFHDEVSKDDKIEAAYRRGFNDAVAATTSEIEAHIVAHKNFVETLRETRPDVANTTDTWMNDYKALKEKVRRLKR